MCGIAGIITHEKARGFITHAKLERMADAVAHRGPNGEGYFLSENSPAICGLAHRRLAITDLSPASKQPLTYKERYVVVHNGEIYNHLKLRQQLEKKGHVFLSQGDTEVIAAAFDEYGPGCVEHFDGMFSFALWDLSGGKLFCARDRFGEKPFFFHHDDENRIFHFASEMKSLWAAGLPRKTRPQMLLHYLTLGLVGHPHLQELTFFEDIFQLPPAHHLLFDVTENKLQIDRYWDLDKEAMTDIGEGEAIDHFRHLLERSVNDRLPGEVAAAVAVSGGLDSTTIVSILQCTSNTTYRHASFSAVFPGFSRDESEYMRVVNDVFGLKSCTITPDADMLLEKIGELIHHQEEPFTTGSVFAQFEVHALAKKNGIKVLMDGQGADEILGGYSRYTHWYLQELVRNGYFSLAGKEAAVLKGNGFLDQWGMGNYLAAYLPGIAAGRLESRTTRLHRHNTDIHAEYLDKYSGAGFIFKPVVEKLNDILYHDTCMGGLQTLLRYADRNAMAHGIEVRLPFLQHELVQFIFSLPGKMKIRNGLNKWIMREAFGQAIPEKILERKGKIGFEPPQENWMKHEKIRKEIVNARQKLVDACILDPRVLQRDIDPQPAYSAKNNDWRYWIASYFI